MKQLPIKRTLKKHKDGFGRSLEKASRFVTKYSVSTKAKETLRETTFKNALVKNVPHRWFSDLAMCNSLIEADSHGDNPL